MQTVRTSREKDGRSRAVWVCMLERRVGKSTIAVNLARQLAAQGYDVILVGLNPNDHVVRLRFGGHCHDTDQSVGDVLFEGVDPTTVVDDTGYGFDVLPSSDDLERIEREIGGGDPFQPSDCGIGGVGRARFLPGP